MRALDGAWARPIRSAHLTANGWILFSVLAAGATAQQEPSGASPQKKPENTATTIIGTLRSRTGQYHPSDLRITLTYFDTVGGGPIQFQRVGFDWVGTFELPAGRSRRFEIGFSKLDPFRIEPEFTFASSSTKNLEFTCMDDTPVFGVSFRIIDADTCAPPASYRLVVERVVPFQLGKGPHWTARRLLQQPLAYTDDYTSFLEGSTYHWVASAPGHQVFVGDQTSFLRASNGAPIADQEVMLPPGWGVEFLVTDGTEHPLPQAAIAFDGGDPMPLDSGGRLVINRRAAPARVDLYCAGYAWRLASQLGFTRDIANAHGSVTLRMDRAR